MTTSKETPENIRRHFNSTGDLSVAFAMGLIPKHELVHGQWYLGACRNASMAVWDSASQKFFYRRTKFGSTFWDEIEHPEDDRGYDLFFATTAINEPQGEPDEQLRRPPAEHTA
mgnify:FL=1